MTQKRKGPASAPTLPDHGSSHPSTGKQMNMHINSIEEAAPLAPHGPSTISIDMATLNELSMSDARALWDAVTTVGNVLCGLLCQPRFTAENGRDYNRAGDALEVIQEWISGFEQAVINVAIARRPTSASEIEDQARLLLQFDAMCCDHLTKLAAMASDAANRERDARAKERRATQ